MIIVFEGPDLTGKTFTLNKVAEKLRETGAKVAIFKFPNYECLGYPEDAPRYGKDCRELLKTGKLDTIEGCRELSIAMIQDKIISLDYITQLNHENDYVLMDRFLLSQKVYDMQAAEDLGVDYEEIVTVENSSDMYKVFEVFSMIPSIIYFDKTKTNDFIQAVLNGKESEDHTDIYDKKGDDFSDGINEKYLVELKKYVGSIFIPNVNFIWEETGDVEETTNKLVSDVIDFLKNC